MAIHFRWFLKLLTPGLPISFMHSLNSLKLHHSTLGKSLIWDTEVTLHYCVATLGYTLVRTPHPLLLPLWPGLGPLLPLLQLACCPIVSIPHKPESACCPPPTHPRSLLTSPPPHTHTPLWLTFGCWCCPRGAGRKGEAACPAPATTAALWTGLGPKKSSSLVTAVGVAVGAKNPESPYLPVPQDSHK